MSTTRKHTDKKPVLRIKTDKNIIVSKTISTGNTLFPEKVKSMNALLAKAKLLS
jgi:hypothetical protein